MTSATRTRQPSLFPPRFRPLPDRFPLDELPTPAARGNAASLDGARMARRVVGRQAGAILAALEPCRLGLTREEIVERCGISTASACARLRELERAGLVATIGRREGSHGVAVQVYATTAAWRSKV